MPPVTSAAVRSKVVVLLLLIHCLFLLLLSRNFVFSLFCYTVLSVLYSFSIKVLKKRAFVVLLYMSSYSLVAIWLFMVCICDYGNSWSYSLFCLSTAFYIYQKYLLRRIGSVLVVLIYFFPIFIFLFIKETPFGA